VQTIVASAYDRWDAGDVEGFLALFPDNAVFVVPGSIRLSGQHDKVAFRTVPGEGLEATTAGRHRQELVCSYDGPSGTMCVFDTCVTIACRSSTASPDDGR
jgi:ketosteroid isomerase-like protein